MHRRTTIITPYATILLSDESSQKDPKMSIANLKINIMVVDNAPINVYSVPMENVECYL